MNTTSNQARAIFLEAIEQQSPEARALFVDEACAGDPELRARVDRLLKSHELLGTFHDDPRTDAATIGRPVTEMPGDTIGPYKLLQQIGEGGMGVVFMAEQTEPIQRTVALKIIKPGMDTRQVIARFEAERQALAMMDHPNIAKVLDAGTTDTGRPYFVMELVKGVPITKYCDDKKLSLRQRLELFKPVCEAVQHAHQKGIIHRDLKPTNVLVAEYDNRAIPKVIDFGVAKATAQKLTEHTMFTEFGQVIGTVEYMSPEQAKFNQLDIDTRSDIYSLGVLLYELLTGSTPFERERLRSAAFDEVLRIIRDEEPPKPSTRLSTSDTLPSIAANRRSEPARLSKDVTGELDWIVMKCLEKDRNRRYETANGLAHDIERYLQDEPVQACPPSVAYRARKFIRRNKAAAAFVVLLFAGIVALTISNVQTRKSERRAITESAKATAISDLLQEMLASANPDAAKGAEYTVRKLLDDFSVGLDAELVHQPEVEAEIRATIGRAYWRLGVTDAASVQITKALELRRSLFGPDDKKVAESLVDYSWNLAEQGRHEEAEKNIREALRIYQLHGASTAQSIHALWSRQRFLISLRRLDEAETAAKEALALAHASPGDYPDVANVLHAQADAQNQQGRYEEAEKTARQSVELHRKVHGLKHPETAWGLRALAQPLINQKKYDEAEAALREALNIFRQSYGGAHKSVSFTIADLNKVLEAKGETQGLVALARQQLENLTQKTKNTNIHEDALYQQGLATAHSNLGQCLDRIGKYDEATAAYRKAIEIEPKNSKRYYGLGWTLYNQHKYAESAAACCKAIEIDPKTPAAYCLLGLDLDCQHKYDEAVGALRKAIEIDPRDIRAYNNLGNALEHQHKYDEAAAAYRKAIELNPKYSFAYTNLGVLFDKQGQLDEAVEAHRKAIKFAPDEPALYLNLGDVLTKQGKLEEAVAALRKAIELEASYDEYLALGDVLLKQEKRDDALAAYRKAVELQPDMASEVGLNSDWFGLARAHWHLGNTSDAQSWFAKAAEWMKKNSPDDPILLESRAEAVELLGIKEGPGIDKPRDKTKDEQSNATD